jgi:N-acetyl-gamma-glutamyl-phosphate reductase
MIKIGITGAASRTSGELIRLLLNHPDAEICALHAPEVKGKKALAIHHGLIGERSMTFTEIIDPAELDVIFINRYDDTSRQITDKKDNYENLRIVDMTSSAYDTDGFSLGLSEVNRKELVRGTHFASLPSSAESLTLTSLYPLAAYLSLPIELEIEISLPTEMIQEVCKDDIEKHIGSKLHSIQQSFSGNISLNIVASNSIRGMRMRTTIHCGSDIEEIFKMYDSIYDDHNFTFMVNNPLQFREVIGTNKCLISLHKEDSENSLNIDSIADARMRGGAGEAVHVMNLLFGLHELTGLSLKASEY